MRVVNTTIAHPPVTTELRGKIRVIAINHAPVNALSSVVREALLRAIELAEAEAQCAAIVLCGAGTDFSGGADIREFGKSGLQPTLPDLCARIEASIKPVIAAIQGVCLGGGFELALSAHYRLAAEDARLGFPEVLLGLMPGAGGTQRSTRLAGARPALDLMLSGRQIAGREALGLGLVDHTVPDGGVTDAAVAYAQEIADKRGVPRRTRDLVAGLAQTESNRLAVEEARAKAGQKFRGQFSPFRIIDAVEAALSTPFDEGMVNERGNFLEALASPQRAGFMHAFLAEREVAKAPEMRIATQRSVASVGVIGGGTMGAGIAVSVLSAGLPVVMIERDEAALARGHGLVDKVFGENVAKGRLGAEDKDQVMSRFSGATRYEALADVDLVIEAAYEDMDVKKQVFAELDRCCKPGCVLATNTSYLDINEIAASISRPEDVIGLHFFSPANIMKLLEIVVPAKVSADVVATGFAFAKVLKKVPVRAGVCDGFIGNRVLATYRLAIDYMVEDGASPYHVDKALRDFGYPMGPLQASDLSGGDIGWATRKRRAVTRDPRQRYVQIADRLCERGWFGQKTGRGWYQYPHGSRIGVPDPEIEAIVEAERQRAGITPRAFEDSEIVRRVMAAMANEGARILEEGIALRPLDIDAVFLHGYGFPRHRGGPMHYADTVGLANVLEDIREFEKDDAFFWRPSPLLVSLVKEGRDFESLNRSPLDAK
ncbi:3-hydroxyacyl-CoA dehydrogenase NAD-binding domain-containing protein [Cupriavidus necator]|uniref:3-hydroxyacyl-CoA dehydrogenase NAD-binding domain-containing protein n=1 Tax=Cupriavidus necator TaxID=106590 RepID=UPI0039C268C0